MFDLTQQFTNSNSYFERFESKANPKPSRVNAKMVRENLVKKGWEHTWGALFGKDFVKDLAEHHRDSIAWAWDAIDALCQGQRPEYFADWPIFPRGHGKSTLARRVAIVDALVSYAYEQMGFCLYLSGTVDKIGTHSLSISNLLQSSETSLSYYCPELAHVRKQEVNNRAMGWRSDFLYTEAGYIFQFGSVMSGLAGANVDNQRPSLIILDDIDDREDSEVQSKTKMKRLTAEVLLMGATGTRTYWAQNLISRYSCMYQVYKNKVKILVNRRPSTPIKAIDNIEVEWRTDPKDGQIKPYITGGEPTWPRMGLIECEEEMHRSGYDAFMRECQHEVEQSREGVLLRNYQDHIHVISESEFASVYGSPREWLKWNKWMIHDWARTKSDEHANVAAYVTVSNQNTRFPGVKFIVEPMAFPAASEPYDVAERFLASLTPFAYESVTWQQLRKDELHRANAHLYTQTAAEKTAFEREVLARVVPRYARPILAHYSVKSGVMSHEQDTIRALYNSCYGFNMWPSRPGKMDHIDTINDDLRIDFSVKHPFREQMGYTRFFIIAKDDQDDPAPRIMPNGLVVRRPSPYKDTLSGSELYDADLLRFQMSEWRLKEAKVTETGESDETPFKGKDDFPNAIQMLYHKRLIINQELSDTEKFEEKMNYEQPGLTLAAIENVPEQNRSAKWVMRMEEQRKFDKENKGDIEAGQGDFAENFQEDDFGWLE